VLLSTCRASMRRIFKVALGRVTKNDPAKWSR
jgi:hypothetical protein